MWWIIYPPAYLPTWPPIYLYLCCGTWRCIVQEGFPGGSWVKIPPANAGDSGFQFSSTTGGSPGGGNGLRAWETPMGR